MPRLPRLNFTGYHHIINRGVARCDIYNNAEDKEKFLQILCKACQTYGVIVHDYCLMDNHYHLLIETSNENLSLFMKQINSNYAIYFNKKNKRFGHLWQGRYKSYFVQNDEYLYMLFRYIEHNPLKAGMCDEIGDYKFTLLSTVLNADLEVIPCAKESKLNKEIHNEGVQEHLLLELDEVEILDLQLRQKEVFKVQENKLVKFKEISLGKHFEEKASRMKRNESILLAIEDGYMQSEIAKYLGISTSAISKIITKNDLSLSEHKKC